MPLHIKTRDKFEWLAKHRDLEMIKYIVKPCPWDKMPGDRVPLCMVEGDDKGPDLLLVAFDAVELLRLHKEYGRNQGWYYVNKAEVAKVCPNLEEFQSGSQEN